MVKYMCLWQNISMDIMNLVLMTQYYDTLKEIGSNTNSNTILLPHKATEGIGSFASGLRESIISGDLATDAIKKAGKGTVVGD